MRAQLIEMLPDLEEEVEEFGSSVLNYITDDGLGSWFRDIEKRLFEKANHNETRMIETKLPMLDAACCDANDILTLHKTSGNEVLSSALNLFCMHYADYWRKHSDVSLTTHVEGPQLLRTRGLHGIQFVFDWTPTEAETKQKKHKQNE